MLRLCSHGLGAEGRSDGGTGVRSRESDAETNINGYD